MPRDAKAYVASKKSETSDLELAQEWAEIEELYSKRYFCGLFLYSSITNVGGGDPTLLLSEICAVIQYIQVILCKKEYTEITKYLCTGGHVQCCGPIITTR